MLSVAQMVEHPFRERAVAGLNLSSAIPMALKMIPVATLLGAQDYKASTGGFSSLTNNALFSHKYRTLLSQIWHN